MIIEKKMKWVLLPVAAIVLTGITSIECDAATIQTLRDVKVAAWNTYYKEDKTENMLMDETFIIDGAVDERGRAKVVITDWSKKAIPRDGKELSVYSSPDQEKEIGKVYGDTIMSILSGEEGWTRIQSGYLRGYVKSESIYSEKKAEEWASQICPERVISDIWNTEIRKEPDVDSNIVEYMNQRRPYDLLSSRNGWNEVQTEEGIKGYVEEKGVKRVRTIYMGRSYTNIGNPQAPFVKMRMTESEKRLLAAIIYCEARGEVFEGQVAVGSVVMNRVHSADFPNTISEVIYQDGQFEPVLMERYEKVLEDDSQISESCYEAVEVIVQGGSNIGDALYFKIGGGGIQIGVHGFY